jgi:hypothetical protein
MLDAENYVIGYNLFSICCQEKFHTCMILQKNMRELFKVQDLVLKKLLYLMEIEMEYLRSLLAE